MGGINVGRWILAGVLAGIVFVVVDGMGSLLYQEQVDEVLVARNLYITPTPGTFALGVVMYLTAGLVAVWFYAAARTRLGAGPATAVKVAIVLWFGMWPLHLISYYMLGLFPSNLLALRGVVTLVATVLATLAGAWLYKEHAATVISP